MRLVHVTLPSADVARAVAFYRTLGLVPLVMEADEAGVAVYARLTFPEGDGTLSLDRRLAPASAAGAGPLITFECADLDRRVQSLRAAGLRFEEGPTTRPWMWREATLIDPDGHHLCLVERASYRLDPPWRLPGTAAPAAAPGDDDADIAFLEARRNRGYLESRIPSGRDDQVAALVDGVAGGAPEVRDAMADRLGPAYTGALLAFAERMATLAVRGHDAAAARRGLIAVGLAWRRCRDVRAAIPVLGLLHDAAARAGAVPAAVFDEAARALPADVAPVLRDFLTRGDLDEIALAMGFAPRADGDGFRYARLWGTGQLGDDD